MLELSWGGSEVQEPELEMLVKGPASQVALLQAVGQLLATNDKASHQWVRGLIEKRVKRFELSTFTLAT